MPSQHGTEDRKKKRVTFGDADTVMENNNDQETPTSMSPSTPSSPFAIRTRKMEENFGYDSSDGDEDDIISSSLPVKSSLTRLLEHSSVADDDQHRHHPSPPSAIDQQKNYRDIKQRYFQSLGVRQPPLIAQKQRQKQQQNTSPSRRRAMSEAAPRDFMSFRQRRRNAGGAIDSDQPSPLAMALQMENEQEQRVTQSSSPLMDDMVSEDSSSVAIPINNNAIPRRKTNSEQGMASTLGVSLSVRKHPRYLAENGSVKDDEGEVPGEQAEMQGVSARPSVEPLRGGDDEDDEEFDQIMQEMTPTGSRPLSVGVRKSAQLQQQQAKSNASDFEAVPLNGGGEGEGEGEEEKKTEEESFTDEDLGLEKLTIRQRLVKLVTSPAVIVSAVSMAVLVTIVLFLVVAIILTLSIMHGDNVMFVCGGLEFTLMVVFSAVSIIGMLPILLFFFNTIKSKYDKFFGEEDDSVPNTEKPTAFKQISSIVVRMVLIIGRVGITLIGLVALLLLIALFIFAVTYRQMYVSSLSGSITMPKPTDAEGNVAADAGYVLDASANIYRESNGIVHIVAKNDNDMFYSQGYATAQDRLWQLDFNRRLAKGTVSELLGDAWLSWDKLRRTLSLTKVADVTYDNLPAATKTILQAYTNGINAFIEVDKGTGKNNIPELIAYPDYTFAKWKPQDLVLLHKEMAFAMSRNMDSEIRRLVALGRDVSIERINELMPDYPSDAPTILSRDEAGIDSGLTEEELEYIYTNQTKDTENVYIPPTQTETASNSIPMGTSSEEMISRIDNRMVDYMLFRSSKFPPNSNAWAVSGKLTKSGKPILANDPHTALEAPSTWHMIHLTSDSTDAIGLSIPGIPGIFIGRNKDISWGFSNLVADTMDLYAMELSADGSKYVHDGEEHEFTTRSETIKILNGEDVAMTVKETLYGPVINDVVDDLSGLNIQPLSLKWAGYDEKDTSLVALTSHMKTSAWSEFSAAIQELVTPALSVLFADSKDTIAYMAAGSIPDRIDGHSGKFVTVGNGIWDYNTTVPATDMPRMENPANGYIIAANQMPVPRGFPYHLCNDVSPHFRAERISELLQQKIADKESSLTREDMIPIQTDVNSTLFHTLRPVFEYIDANQDNKTQTEKQKFYIDSMLNWDGVMDAGSVEATFFEKWLIEMDVVSADELGASHPNSAYFLIDILLKNTHVDPACDKWGTCQEAAKAIFNQTVDYMEQENGPRWAVDVHHAEHTHAALANQWCNCFGIRAIFVPGGTETVNFAPITNTRNFASLFGPSARMITEMLPADQLTPDLYTTAVGQSGNLFESSYSNMLLGFQEGLYQKMYLNFDAQKQSSHSMTINAPA